MDNTVDVVIFSENTSLFLRLYPAHLGGLLLDERMLVNVEYRRWLISEAGLRCKARYSFIFVSIAFSSRDYLFKTILAGLWAVVIDEAPMNIATPIPRGPE